MSKNKIFYTKGEIDFFIILKEIDLEIINSRIDEYCDIYTGTKKEFRINLCKARNHKGYDDTILVLPIEMGIYNIVNLFGWLSDSEIQYNTLICNNTISNNKSFYVNVESENVNRDTIIGRTNVGKSVYAFMPETFSLESFDVYDIGDNKLAVDDMLNDRGYLSLKSFTKELEIKSAKKIYMAV